MVQIVLEMYIAWFIFCFGYVSTVYSILHKRITLNHPEIIPTSSHRNPESPEQSTVYMYHPVDDWISIQNVD